MPTDDRTTLERPLPPRPSPTVLIVEDDVDTRELLGQLLESEGFLVTLAENGQDALDRLEKGGRACVILLDLMMPVMDGWQFRKRQQADQRIASIPVVVVSAVGTGQRVEALDPAAYFPKPIDLEELVATLSRICA